MKIFQLASFTDTAVAIQETKAANSLAASIRRVALLTFSYLPLQVAAVSLYLCRVPSYVLLIKVIN